MIGLRPGQGADDEIEIGGRKAFPTIRPDHRELIMSISDAAWQARGSRLFASNQFL